MWDCWFIAGLRGGDADPGKGDAVEPEGARDIERPVENARDAPGAPTARNMTTGHRSRTAGAPSSKKGTQPERPAGVRADGKKR